MKIVADENVDRLIIDRLRKEGHIVLSVARQFTSSPDSEVLGIARDEQALLITEDKDLESWSFIRSHPTSVYFLSGLKVLHALNEFGWFMTLS